MAIQVGDECGWKGVLMVHGLLRGRISHTLLLVNKCMLKVSASGVRNLGDLSKTTGTQETRVEPGLSSAFGFTLVANRQMFDFNPVRFRRFSVR